MSIKDLFNNKGTPKIQKSVSSDEMVATVESSEFLEAKRKQFDEFIPPIDFATASNFAKFGSAELYYEKAFERIHNSYPYDGTLAEKVEFENSSSYLDKYVFDNLYPRTNGYINFDGSTYITAFGGPHTASGGMIGKALANTFENSSVYNESKKRTSAFEFRREDGISSEFWLKVSNTSSTYNVFHVSSSDGAGIKLNWENNDFKFKMHSASVELVSRTITGMTAENDEWNHYALTFETGSSNFVLKFYKNGQLAYSKNESANIRDLIPVSDGLHLRIGTEHDGTNPLSGALDEFRYWKSVRTSENVFNNWFGQTGGGTNKNDANVDLGLYFKFNEGITQIQSIDEVVLDYSGRFNNGKIEGYNSSTRNTGSAITEKLSEPEFLDPIIYSSHPDVISKKAEYKLSGSNADRENSTMFINYFPFWMQEEDKQNGNQLKYLCQILGSYFDTLWHQISFMNKIHDDYYVDSSKEPMPFAKKLLYNKGFVIQDLFVDANLLENLKDKDDNEVYEKSLNDVRNTIYHNIYNNLDGIYKSKGTEKSFRNFFRSVGIGQEIVKLRMYADDSTFVLRNNYEFKSHEKRFLNFNSKQNHSATIYQTSSANNSNIYLPKDSDYTGSFTLQAEVILPRKQKRNEVGYNPFSYLTSSIFGYHTGQSYTHPSLPDGLQAYVVHSTLERNVPPSSQQRVKFVLTGSNINLTSPWFNGQYENNKWSLAIKMKHSSYPRPNIAGSSADDYLLEFYGVEANGNTKLNYFLLSTSSVEQSYYSSDKIFYAGAHRTNFTSSTILEYSDVKLGYVRYWHSYLSNDAIDQHAFDSETFGANEPFEQDLLNVYPVEIPREKTLSFHWAFDNITGSDSSGEILITDFSSGSSENTYGSLSDTIQRTVEARAKGFTASSSDPIDINFLYSAKKRQPDDLLSSDLTTVKTDETEQFFVDEDVSDNFYSFEKSMWGVVSEEMLNMFSTALDLNNLIGQPNQKYHHRYNMMDFLRDRFFEDVENEPDLEKFTSFYKWIDDSISLALKQLTPASSRFSEKINNIIESHVLERNKYVHKIPITTTFESTEGSIKGISEMKYNWQFGHAPVGDYDEGNSVLWQRERLKKEGLRETLRNSRNNYSLQSSGLIRKEIDGTARVSDTYSIRRFAKTYDVGIVSQETIHGGTNFGRKKNLHLFHESVAPHGGLGSVSTVPQNVVTVGVGLGYSGIVESTKAQYNRDESPLKRKLQVNAQIGNREGEEYAHDILGDFVLPMNVMSGTVNSGYNLHVAQYYASGVYFANLHNDTVGNYNERSMQGPFTEQHVGGLQYRHVDINKYDSEKGRINTTADRPEGWALLIREHIVSDPTDSAFGFVGADYEAPYPSATLQKATRYRDEHAKRPLNIRNIKTVSGSFKAGNYTNEIQIFSVSPTHQKTWAIEAYDNPNIEILPTSISSALPQTTNYQTLMGIATYSSGNVFGVHSNNRQPDGAVRTAGSSGTFAKGSFELSGATVSGLSASGSFNVTGSPYAGAFASGSFDITSSMVQGTEAVGSFSMSGAFSPAVSASFDFQVIGRTILGEEASGSFEVSGAYVAPAYGTASFDVSALPVGGKRAYHIFDACYEMAADGYLVGLGRNTDSNSVEVDYDNSITSGNTAVYPVEFQKAAEVSGSSEYFSGSASFTSNQEFILNFWISASANAINGDIEKYLYESRDSSADRKSVQLFFSASSGPRKLVIRRYVDSGSDYFEYVTNDDICSDSGLPWTMVTVLAQGGSETAVYFNATASTFNGSLGQNGKTTDFNSMTVDEHHVMGDSGNNSHWSGSARISDFMMWNKNLPSGNPAAINAFIGELYNDGIYEPSVPSGSLLGWRYTFGDDSSDSNTRVVHATYGSGSNISGSYNDSFSNSLFAVTKSASQYFTDLKTAIESHNSDGTYFTVNYDEYNTTASSTLTTFVSGTYEHPAFVPGEVSSSISIGDTLQFARFYVNSKQESDNANYDITASVSNGGKSGQERGFIQVHTGSQSSAQQNALDAFDYSKISIDSNNIFFDDHANRVVVAKVATFSTTGSSIEGSSTTNNARFENTSYPSASAIYGAQDISISFWHEADGSNKESIVQFATSANSLALQVYAQNEALSLRISDSDRDSMTWTKDFSSTNINAASFNHYTWVYSESTQEATLYANAISQSSIVKTESGTFAGMNDSQFQEIYVGGRSDATTEELRGKLTELSIWSGSLGSTTVSEIYNDGRAKDLYEIVHSDNVALAHWYRLGEESVLPSVGTHLGSVPTIPDATSHFAPADLTVKTGSVFTVRSGIPSDTISDTTFWDNLSSSIEANVADYDVAYVNNTTYATFTITHETIGTIGNTGSLSENSTLITNLETSTGGGVDESGTNDGSYVVIGGKRFESDDDDTTDTASIFYIQNTGSNTEFWNALSQSIKDNTNFDTINIGGSGDTRIFSITSSIRQSSDNSAITAVNGEFSIINDTAGGADDTGAVDGHNINLRASNQTADSRIFVVDRDNDGVDDTPARYRYVHSVQSSNADWWNALSASIKAEGYDVSYVADSPSAGTASFTVTSYLTGASGNSGVINYRSGDTFTAPSGDEFEGGLDASGSISGHTITVSGTVFSLIDTGVPTATQVLVTGSSVTSESMFEDLRAKIQAATIYTVTTASSGIPRLFELTASVTGSGRSPSISTSDNTFTLVNTGTDGVEEVGAEAGDSITIASTVFEIVSGTPTGTEISFTGSSEDIRNALSQSIKNNTIFDDITVTDLGTGYHRFNLTASAVGTTHNGLFTTNSSGVRDTFQNLVGAAGGEDSAGIEDQDRITIGTTTFHLTASSPGDDSTNKYIETTGSSDEIWTSLEEKIESTLSYNVVTSSAGGIATFNLTGSTTGSALNVSLSEIGNSFTSLVDIEGGTDETGIKDRDSITIANGSDTFILTSSAPSDTSNTFYIETTGTSEQIWASLESKIEANTSYTVNTSSAGGTALFSLTASVTGSASNSSLSVSPNPGRSFFSLSNIAGGTDIVPTIYGPDNVIQIPRVDLTGSERNVVTRFSAPGGVEVQTIGYLDAYTSTYSVHNAMPFRNLSVLGSGSGEEGTIRVEDHLGLRRGLRTLRGLHMGKFGIDSQYGSVTADDYPSSGSFNKQYRNTSQRMEYSGSSIITGSNYDNAFINTPIPRSELQYSWIHNATSGSNAPTQRIVGYAPKDGVVSSSAGFVEAIVFPTASSIFGS